MWRKWWANNVSKMQMGFNSAFKGLKLLKTPGNGRLNNLNDPVLNVLITVTKCFFFFSKFCQIWRCSDCYYEECCVPGYDAVQSGTNVPIYRGGDTAAFYMLCSLDIAATFSSDTRILSSRRYSTRNLRKLPVVCFCKQACWIFQN